MLARGIAEGLAQAGQNQGHQAERNNTSRLKLRNPESFDGKNSTTFNTWWESILEYIEFYPETRDAQRIVWVGTLLADTARAWDQHRRRTMGERDTWTAYTSAIRTEYWDTREAANTQLKLGQLKYKGDIKAYLTKFRELNIYARATGESLMEKKDQAMPDNIVDMRFTHSMEEFVDDEHFLTATYSAGLHVERRKALKVARDGAMGTSHTSNPKQKDERTRNTGRMAPEPEPKGSRNSESETQSSNNERINQFGKPRHCTTKEEALKGVPAKEHDDYFKENDCCWRCGFKGHRKYECFAHTTKKGTTLPNAPWKAAAVTSGQKRKRTEEPEETGSAQQQKVGAAEV